MSEELYALTLGDVDRIRDLLAAWEQGRLRVDPPPERAPTRYAPESRLLQAVNIIPPNTVGTAYLCAVDDTTNPPTVTTLSDVVSVWNDSFVAIQPSVTRRFQKDPTSSLWFLVPYPTDNYVQATSTTHQLVTTLWENATVAAFPAKVVDPETGSNGGTAWLLDVNFQTPVLGYTYHARQVDIDPSGVGVYSVCDCQDASTVVRGLLNATTQGVGGVKTFVGDSSANTITIGCQTGTVFDAPLVISNAGTLVGIDTLIGANVSTFVIETGDATRTSMRYGIKESDGTIYYGISGTDTIGNIFTGGILTTLGSGLSGGITGTFGG